MKQLHNKIIFGLILLLGLSFFSVSRVDAMLIQVEEILITEPDDATGGNKGGTGVYTPYKLTINANLDGQVDPVDHKIYYYPGDTIEASVTAEHYACSNLLRTIKIDGYIVKEGGGYTSDTKEILSGDAFGGVLIAGEQYYTSPNILGNYFFKGTAKLYCSLKETKDCVDPSAVMATISFEIPFKIIARPTNPTGGKTISVRVYDITDRSNPIELKQDPITRETIKPIAPGTPIRLSWVATGFNKDTIVCSLPNGDPLDRDYSDYEYIQPPEPKNTYPQITTYYQITCVD